MKRFKIGFGLGLLVIGVVLAITLPSRSASVYRLGAEASGGQAWVQAGVGEWPTRLTNSVAVNATNALFNTPNGKEMCLQFSGVLNGAGTAVIGLGVLQSVDGNKWQMIKLTGIAGNGNTEVAYVTNFFVGAAQYFKLYLTNAEATSHVTNYSVYVNFR